MATIQQPVQHPQPDAYRLPHPGPYQRAPEIFDALDSSRRMTADVAIARKRLFPPMRRTPTSGMFRRRHAWGGRPGDGVLLYGAHGQPLPPPQAPPVPAAVPHGQENTLPPPVNLYQQPHPSYGRPGPGPTGPPPSLAPAIYHDPRASKGTS
ncbi:hypothetical protein CIRG_02604 [Coccidioides immitis RMSCC 2394]|uniref:Uncharacterized protein n=1 Tax=Coccidioides immitis RMSCC 2394 TaxID=404692 RepID=A0A0J7AZJ0_COCIT|nr:hypothetical protein CIRG_02604 [Coccidioides immitis RMSCC 2394]